MPPRIFRPCYGPATYEERRNFRPKNGTWAAHCNCLSAGIFFWHESFAPSGFLFLLLLFYITRMFQEFDRWRNIILGLSFTVYNIVLTKFLNRQRYFERILTISNVFSSFLLHIQHVGGISIILRLLNLSHPTFATTLKNSKRSLFWAFFGDVFGDFCFIRNW